MSRSICAAPSAFASQADAQLEGCFGHVAGLGTDAFKAVLLAALDKRAAELKGLALSPMPEGLKKANAYVEAGQTVQAVPMAVPADYAAFTVLGR